jgi:hypothetical protein
MSINTPGSEMSAFERLLPSIRKRHGSAWAVVANDACQGAFRTYQEAVEFAVGRFEPGDFLVKHTQAQTPYIPFVVVQD